MFNPPFQIEFFPPFASLKFSGEEKENNNNNIIRLEAKTTTILYAYSECATLFCVICDILH